LNDENWEDFLDESVLEENKQKDIKKENK